MEVCLKEQRQHTSPFAKLMQIAEEKRILRGEALLVPLGVKRIQNLRAVAEENLITVESLLIRLVDQFLSAVARPVSPGAPTIEVTAVLKGVSSSDDAHCSEEGPSSRGLGKTTPNDRTQSSAHPSTVRYPT